MDETIKVTVLRPNGRTFWQMQYRHPDTGLKVRRSCKTTSRRDAERMAAKWESELRAGRYKSPLKTTWAEFREKYEAEVLPGLAERTDQKVGGVFNAVERILKPAKLRDVTAERLSYFQSVLREERVTVPSKEPDGEPKEKLVRRSENTIKGILAHLLAALYWAKDVGLLVDVPKVQAPRRAKDSRGMKGRPITTEEFERMLAKVPDVVGNESSPLFRYYLRGLWLSGLRLTESLELYWDRDDRLCVDLTGRRPMLRIPAELEKGHKDRVLPMAPDFAALLLAIPAHQRRGRVFNLRPRSVRSDRLSHYQVSRLVAEIGERAGVKVQTDPVTGAIKYASEHDLRRSFGARWSNRVMP